MPEPSASTEATALPSMETVTVLLGSAVPEMVGVVVLTKTPLAGDSTVGAVGATVSTVKEMGLEGELLLPAASCAWAVRDWGP